VKAFQTKHFGLRHRLVAFISTRMFSNLTYTVRHGLAAGMRRKGGLGFLPVAFPETTEERFLSNLDLAGKTVYDLGGFEGVLTLFFARKANSVITFEPNPRNYQRCIENVRLNALTNVRVFGRGVSSDLGEIEITYDPLMPGAASGDPEISQQISATVGTSKTASIQVGPLDREIETLSLPAPDLIKIDIEGMELPALRGMARTLALRGPDLFIELHGAELADKVANATSVVELLEQAGYYLYDVENKKALSAAALGPRAPSHLFCTKERSRLPGSDAV
jgi:FkbM family methyltransferase